MYCILFLINNVLQYVQVISKGRGFLDNFSPSIFICVNTYYIVTIKMNIKIDFASFLFAFVLINYLFIHLQVKYMYNNKFDFDCMCVCVWFSSKHLDRQNKIIKHLFPSNPLMSWICSCEACQDQCCSKVYNNFSNFWLIKYTHYIICDT